MSTETASKLPTHQVSKRSRAPPPPTKRPSTSETANGSQSEQEKDILKSNGNVGDGAQGIEERQLTLVLPGDKVVKASVDKTTPILDLLIMIASKNRLNPSGHMIAQPGTRPKDPPIHLKPSQTLADIVGDTVYIIPRNQKELFVYKREEDKKSAVYEQTTRITIVSCKNHKMVLRVDPEKTLKDLLPRICDERGVDLGSHSLRLVNRPNDPYDLNQTLESTGVIEFLLVDAKGQPAGSELEVMPEPKKKKGSFFNRITKKKKEYEFGGGGTIPEAPLTTTTSSEAPEQRTQRHSSPPTRQPAPSMDAPSTQEQDDSNSNTLKKRRPAPPPPMGKTPPVASDEEKMERDAAPGDSNTLRKRRAPAPPRPTSPPRRTQSLDIPSERPPRPTSPPVRSGVSVDEGMTDDTVAQEVAETKHDVADKPPRPTKPPRPPSITRGSSLDTPPTDPAAEPVFVPPPPPEIPPSPDGEQEDISRLIEQGRLNQSFDDGVTNEEFGEDSPSVCTESLSSSVTETGLDEAFEEAIAMGAADVVVQEEELSPPASPPEDTAELEVEVAGLDLEAPAEETEALPEPELDEVEEVHEEEDSKDDAKEELEEEAVDVEEEEKEQVEEKTEDERPESHEDGEQVALLVINPSYANSNTGHGDRTTLTNPSSASATPGDQVVEPKVSNPSSAEEEADWSKPAVRPARAKSESSLHEAALRERKVRSISLSEYPQKLKLSYVQESADLENAVGSTVIGASISTADRTVIQQPIETPHALNGKGQHPLEGQTLRAEMETSNVAYSGSTDKDDKAQKELLSHMMEMSLTEDSKETYPPNTQAEDTNYMLEEKSVHALAFNVTRETTETSGSAAGSVDGDSVGKEEKPKSKEGSPKKVEPVSEEKLTDQYALLQSQLAALQQQMMMSPQAGMIGMQMQQMQQQMLLQQQMISQMMMSTSQQPMVIPVGYQQQMMPPQQQMMSPPQHQQQQMMVSPHQMISPQQHMLSPQQQQQMMMSPQQLMMTPPMMYSSVPIQQNAHPQPPSTATVQAQQTPILATHEVKDSRESPNREGEAFMSEPVNAESLVDNKITSEGDKGEGEAVERSETVPRPLSPALRAESISVSHPTYHFARSRDVPNGDAKVTKASPPNTLRSPKTQQRPALLISEGEDSPEKSTASEKKISTENLNEAVSPPRVDVNQNATPGDRSSISEFAVSGSSSSSTEPVSPKSSEKPKKSGFSLFKKKTPKYSYILSAQREFSKKSETDRQRTSSNPPKPAEVQSDSNKGSRGRANTLDSYDPNRVARDSASADPAAADFERDMKRNVHVPPNLAISHSAIPPRPIPKTKQTKDQTSPITAPTTKPLTHSPKESPLPVTNIDNQATNSASTNKVPMSPSTSDVAVTMPRPAAPEEAIKTSLSPATSEPLPSTAYKSQGSPTHTNPEEATLSKPLESPCPVPTKESPVPPSRKTHSKPEDASRTVKATEDTEGASGPAPRRRAKVINLRALKEEQDKIKAEASVSELRQIFGQGNQ